MLFIVYYSPYWGGGLVCLRINLCVFVGKNVSASKEHGECIWRICWCSKLSVIIAIKKQFRKMKRKKGKDKGGSVFRCL